MYNYDRTISTNQRSFYERNGILLGLDARGREVVLREGNLEGHMLVIGKSGTGKSNFIFNLTRNLANSNANIVLLDPHGPLSDSLIQNLVKKSLVYVSPGISVREKGRFAVSFNPLSTDSEADDLIERTTGWVRDMMAREEAFSNGSWGPRLEVIFRVILGDLLRREKGSNLSDLASLITDRTRLKDFVSTMNSESSRKYLESQIRDWKGWMQYISSTMNRLMPLLSADSTKHLISGREDSFDLGSCLLEGNRFITVNISKTQFSDEVVRIVSSLFLVKMWTTILDTFGRMGRKTDTYIIIDEFQSIPAGIIDTLLREGRKFGIKVVLATQFVETSERGLMKSIFGNIRNFVSFNISDDDARELSGLIPGRRQSAEFMNTLIAQKMHSATILSQSIDGISGPLTFTPVHDRIEADPGVIRQRKEESLEKYSARLVEETVERKTLSVHESIIDAFQNYLLKHGVELKKGERIENSIPDGYFSLKGREFIVEVEVSDISRKSRVLSKLRSYTDRSLILITQEGQGQRIHELITNPTKYRIKRGIAMEFPIQDGADRIYTRDIARSIRNTLILEYNGTTFSSYWLESTRRFNLKHLIEPATFERELSHGEFGEVRNYVYRLMIEADSYALKKTELVRSGIITASVMENYLARSTEKDSDYIFLRDLFKK